MYKKQFFKLLAVLILGVIVAQSASAAEISLEYYTVKTTEVMPTFRDNTALKQWLAEHQSQLVFQDRLPVDGGLQILLGKETSLAAPGCLAPASQLWTGLRIALQVMPYADHFDVGVSLEQKTDLGRFNDLHCPEFQTVRIDDSGFTLGRHESTYLSMGPFLGGYRILAFSIN